MLGFNKESASNDLAMWSGSIDSGSTPQSRVQELE
jgi:hypothetical protein